MLTVSPPVGRGHGRGRTAGLRVVGPILRPTYIPAAQQVIQPRKSHAPLMLLTLHHTIALFHDFVAHTAVVISYVLHAHVDPTGLKRIMWYVHTTIDSMQIDT